MTGQLIVPSNPTPNGDLHIGHIAGPFIGADLLRRAAAARGEPAAVVLGTAWQNTHVLLAARRQGRDHLATAAEFAAQIEESFAAAGIGYDVMLRHPDIPAIEDATRAAWTRLRAAGRVVVRDTAAQYCPRCEAWRFQGFVAGRCPHCGSPDAAGIDCEGCGLYHDDAELGEPVCTICRTATVPRPLRRAFLDLEPQRGWFERYLGGCTLGDPVRAFAETVLRGPLPSVAVTFASEVGIPAADPDVPGQRIYPAFELAPRYAVMVRRLRAGGGWHAGAGTRTSMLFGADNAFERVFLFPAVLRALVGAPFPEVLQSTYFYLLNGAKFSTSRRHLVGVAELVEAAGMDAVRLYLAATRPERAPSDFRRAGFAASAELATVRRLLDRARSGSWPAGAGPAGPAEWSRLAEAAGQLDAALRPERLSCVRAAAAVLELADLAELAGADATFAAAVEHCLVNGAAAVIPDTAARLGAAFAVPPARFDGSPRPAHGVRLG